MKYVGANASPGTIVGSYPAKGQKNQLWTFAILTGGKQTNS